MKRLLSAALLGLALTTAAHAFDSRYDNPQPGAYAPGDYAIAMRWFDMNDGELKQLATHVTDTRFRGGALQCQDGLLHYTVEVQKYFEWGFFVAPAQLIGYTVAPNSRPRYPALVQHYCTRLDVKRQPIDASPPPALDAARRAYDAGFVPRQGAFQQGE